MRSILKYTLSAAAALFLLISGISFFTVKDYEFLYSANPPIITCLNQGCVMIYNLKLGNTGRNSLTAVTVTLANEPLSHAMLPPKVTDFGKVPRESNLQMETGRTQVSIGNIESGKRVEISLLLKYDTREDAPSWDEILLQIKSAQAAAQPGDPEMVRFGRFLYGLLAGIL